MFKNRAAVLLLCAAFLSDAVAGRCEDLAQPKEFNNDTAMQAVFCTYDLQRHGTLLPPEHTRHWDVKAAEVLATPLYTATYSESGQRKGVLVVQRQALIDGEPEVSHVAAPDLSVYVFRFDAGVWRFEKGKKQALTAGANGQAPEVRLAKLGDDKYGLWFDGGDIHQGVFEGYALAGVLSEAEIGAVGDFDTGMDNGGTCSDDPAERGGLIGECWGYEGEAQFVRVPERDYYLLRIAYSGTQMSEGGQIVDKAKAACYRLQDGRYRPDDDPKCQCYPALDAREVFSQ